MKELFCRFDGMTWPHIAGEVTDLERRLRYGSPSESDSLAAASVISAYRALVWASARKRNAVVRGLRDAAVIHPDEWVCRCETPCVHRRDCKS